MTGKSGWSKWDPEGSSASSPMNGGLVVQGLGACRALSPTTRIEYLSTEQGNDKQNVVQIAFVVMMMILPEVREHH